MDVEENMTSLWMCSLSAALLVLSMATTPLQGQEVHKRGRYFVGETVQTFDVAPGGTLRMTRVRGDVTVRGTDARKVVVREKMRLDVYTEEEARTAMQRVRTAYEVDGDVITIEGSHESRSWIKSNYLVEVPRRFNVEIEARQGDLEVSGIQGQVQLSTAAGSLVMKQIDGEVEARTSGGDVEASDIGGDIRVRTSGGGIRLQRLSGVVDASTSGGDVTVTHARKSVRLRSAGGDITVEDAGEVNASTSGGDVDIRQARGAVSARTAGGDVTLAKCAGPVEASTAGGEVRASDIGVGVVAKTAGGEIDLDDIRGYVEARTAGGSIQVEVTLTDFTQDHHIDLSTAAGDLLLVLPKSIPATVKAKIRMQRWGDYTIQSDFPLTLTEEGGRGRNNRRILRASGDLNGGGDLIRLETINGDIVIRKR